MKMHYFAILSMAAMLAGCTAAEQQPTVMQPVPQPMAYREAPPTYRNPGSIFDDSNAQYLFADSRARNVGDIVMVNVVESSAASNTAKTETERESTNEYGVESFLSKGAIPLFGGLKGVVGPNPTISTSTTKEFTGEGTTSRRNTVAATVAAQVIDVLPNGMLQIEGSRETKVNNETQYLVVTGLVRARDIRKDNSIMSTQVANARIAYFGKGVVSDQQRPGWFTRLMDTIWPL